MVHTEVGMDREDMAQFHRLRRIDHDNDGIPARAGQVEEVGTYPPVEVGGVGMTLVIRNSIIANNATGSLRMDRLSGDIGPGYILQRGGPMKRKPNSKD